MSLTKLSISFYFFFFLQIMSIFLPFIEDKKLLMEVLSIFIFTNFMNSNLLEKIKTKNNYIFYIFIFLIFTISNMLFFSFYKYITLTLCILSYYFISYIMKFVFSNTSKDKINICMSLLLIFLGSFRGLYYSSNSIYTIGLFCIGLSTMPLNFFLSFTRSYYNDLGIYINWTSILSHFITIIFLIFCGRTISINNFYKINLIISFINLIIILLSTFPKYLEISEKNLKINKDLIYTIFVFIISMIFLSYGNIQISSNINNKNLLIYMFVGKIAGAIWFLYSFKGDFKKSNDQLLKISFNLILIYISQLKLYSVFFIFIIYFLMGLLEVVGGFLLPVYILNYTPNYVIPTIGFCNIATFMINFILTKIIC
ncbi:hypothetical protein AB836_01715 [Rickettsiales bacterium (ex Bugula neritina AB1)]|nr:hypothetical protein AB836_01715 [Rickettsiales bacterium (ex Bugula neritina AB1)]